MVGITQGKNSLTNAIRKTWIYPWDIGRKVMVGNDNDQTATLLLCNVRWMEQHVMFTKKSFRIKNVEEFYSSILCLNNDLTYFGILSF